jgi:hypothetical protein
MRTTLRCTSSLLALALLGAQPVALTHHSAAVYYLMDSEITVSGTVTEFRMGNPHARIYFDVTAPDGSVAKWMAEGGSRTVMLRTGWTGDEVKVGDTVTIHGHPSRDGDNIVHMVNVDLADGRRMFGEDTNPDSVQRMRDARRRRG